jgi:hypothetical protein
MSCFGGFVCNEMLERHGRKELVLPSRIASQKDGLMIDKGILKS